MVNSLERLLQACGKVSNCLESLLQVAAGFQTVWKGSCNRAARFPNVGKAPASCGKVSKRWKVSCRCATKVSTTAESDFP